MLGSIPVKHRLEGSKRSLGSNLGRVRTRWRGSILLRWGHPCLAISRRWQGGSRLNPVALGFMGGRSLLSQRTTLRRNRLIYPGRVGVFGPAAGEGRSPFPDKILGSEMPNGLVRVIPLRRGRGGGTTRP